jgi:hypothetical protein
MANDIPSNISSATAEIYEASLMFQQCGMCENDTVVLETGDSWTSSGNDIGWKLVCLEAGELTGFETTNMSAGDNAKLTGTTIPVGFELMGAITSIEVSAGKYILYKDCPQS